MTQKRKTKAQREAEAKAALLRRVTDVFTAALGAEWAPDDFATAETLSRAIPALGVLFGTDNKSFLWSAYNLEHYDNPQAATDFLFEYGIRA